MRTFRLLTSAVSADELIIPGSRKKAVLLLFIAAALVAVGIVLIVIGQPWGWLMAGFFGLGIPAAIWMLVPNNNYASDVHIAAIALAFVLSVLAMVLYPAAANRAATAAPRSISWSLAAAVALSVALGHSLAPMGIGQRFAALCLLSWLAVIGWRFMTARDQRVVSPACDAS